MNDDSSARRRGMRAGFRRFAVGAFFLIVPLAAHALWDFIEVRRLVREVEAIRAKGEPVTEREAGLDYAGSTAEHDRASREYLAAAMLALNFRRPPELTRLDEWVLGGVAVDQPRNQMQGALDDAVDAVRDALVLADKANGREFKGFHPGTEYSYRASGLSALSALLATRTIQSALRGNADAAAESAVQSLRLRRVSRYVRWLYLMNAGPHEVPILLSVSSPSSEHLLRLQDALEAEERDHDLARDVAARRAWALEMIWERYYGSDPAAPRAYRLPIRSAAEWVMRPWFTHQVIRMLQEWASLVDAARKPWPQKAAAMTEITERVRNRLPVAPSFATRMASSGMLQSFGFVSEAGWGADVLITNRCARTAVAVERFRRDHDGTLPGGLDDLVPKYMPAVPQDPLTGRPLLFRTATGTYTIYSVGADGKDDGGDLASELLEVINRGWGRRLLKGKDLGVRIVINNSM